MKSSDISRAPSRIQFVAGPPDVREGFAFPRETINVLRLCLEPSLRRSLISKERTQRRKGRAFPHIRRQSRCNSLVRIPAASTTAAALIALPAWPALIATLAAALPLYL